MIVSSDTITLSISSTETKRLAGLVGTQDERELRKAVLASMARIEEIVHNEEPEPAMLDLDVFLANKMLADKELRGVDAKALKYLVESWTKAENALKPEARAAVRLLERLVSNVLNAADKKVFETYFNKQLAPRMEQTVAQYMRMFLEVMQGWVANGASQSAQPHYLENVMASIRKRTVEPAVEAHSKKYVTKRLIAAKTLLDDFIFE